jgi:hypothetical protein
MKSATRLEGDTVLPQTTDDSMDLIRELLIGEQQRRSGARMDALDARLSALEEDMMRRFDALNARIDALAEETKAGRRAAFEELSRGVTELGERVRNLSQS